MKKQAMIAVAALCALSSVSSAQSLGDAAGWTALSVTPSGAFAPMPSGGGIALRYGSMSKSGSTVSNFGAGLHLGPLGITAGITKPDCVSGTKCGVYMAGVDLRIPIISQSMGSGTLKIALVPAAGYAKPRDSDLDFNYMSGAVTLPFVLSLPLGTSAKVTPYLAPGFGYGRISGGGDTESGTRTMFGGGIGIGNASSSFQLSAGFQKVFLTDAPTVIGVNLSIGGGSR